MKPPQHQRMIVIDFTKKGAFFCKIAGVLDMPPDCPGIWTIEPEWRKRT